MWIGIALGVIFLLWLISRIGSSKSKKPSGKPRESVATTKQRISPVKAGRIEAVAAVKPASATKSDVKFDTPTPLQWHGTGTQLAVGGLVLKDPHVYASRGAARSYDWANDPSEILIDAEVRRPRGAVLDLGYWPWYSRLLPEQRYQYLEWLASGRRSLPSTDGLLFLYFYGLERRLLVDKLDKEWVLREVVRLLKLDEPRRGSPFGKSFRNYACGLLWFQVAREPAMFDARAFGKLCELTERWSESTIPVPLAWLCHHASPLPTEFAQTVARLHPDSVQSVVMKRVGDQFRELFTKRYGETFGRGLMLKAGSRPRRFLHRPASGGLSETSCDLYDPTGLPGQFEPLAKLWNGCVADLRQLSKVSAGSAPKVTVEVWLAMPEELRKGLDHPLSESVQAIVRARRNESPPDASTCVVPVERFATLLSMPAKAKLTATQSKRIADLLSHTGFAIEPDPMVDGKSYEWDDLVGVFLRGDTDELDVARYLGAASLLRLGLMVAEADGEVDAEELRHLGEHIDTVFELSPHEKARLDALRAVLIQGGSNLTAVAKRIEALPAPTRRAVGRMLVALAASSGSIAREEQASLRKCFRTLGLRPQQLDEAIAEVCPAAGVDTVTVSRGEPAPVGEPIPQTTGIRLNREAISAILAETREVAHILSAAMAVEESESQAASPTPAPLAVLERPEGGTLPDRYKGLYADLIAQDRWTKGESESLARKHGLMLAGSIEAINDWALETFGAPIIEESDGALTLDRSIL